MIIQCLRALPRRRQRAGAWLHHLLGTTLILLGSAGLGAWSWNHSMVNLFSMPRLTFEAALGIAVLLLLLRLLLTPTRRWTRPRPRHGVGVGR